MDTYNMNACLKTLLPLILSTAMNGGKAHGAPRGNIVITQTVSAACTLSGLEGGLQLDFSSTAGEAGRRSAAFSIKCSAPSNVGIRTSWDRGSTSGGLTTFDNGDKLLARVCDSGGANCKDANGDPLIVASELSLILQLDYTATIAETVRRSGLLTVTYE